MSSERTSAPNWHEWSPRFFHYYLTLSFPLLEDFKHRSFPIQVKEWIFIDMCQRISKIMALFMIVQQQQGLAAIYM
jgi:hypothetical protein